MLVKKICIWPTSVLVISNFKRKMRQSPNTKLETLAPLISKNKISLCTYKRLDSWTYVNLHYLIILFSNIVYACTPNCILFITLNMSSFVQILKVFSLCCFCSFCHIVDPIAVSLRVLGYFWDLRFLFV